MNCLSVIGETVSDNRKVWSCKLNGFLVNARMNCEEWTGKDCFYKRKDS